MFVDPGDQDEEKISFLCLQEVRKRGNIIQDSSLTAKWVSEERRKTRRARW